MRLMLSRVADLWNTADARLFLFLAFWLLVMMVPGVTQEAFMSRYRRDTLYGADMGTVYRDGRGVRSLMIEVVMSHQNKTYDEAKLLLDTKVRFHSWSHKSGTSRVRPGKKLRAAIPHWMSDLKALAAAAFYNKFNELHQKDEVGSVVYDKRGNRSVRLFPVTCLQCLWKDSFLKTVNGRLSMKAALAAVYDKWGCINDFLVPRSATNAEDYYKVTALLYSLLALKVSGLSAAPLCFERPRFHNTRAGWARSQLLTFFDVCPCLALSWSSTAAKPPSSSTGPHAIAT